MLLPNVSLLQDPTRKQRNTYQSRLLERFLIMTISQASLVFLVTWTVLRSTDQLFCRMSRNWALSDVFLMVKTGTGLVKYLLLHS